MATGHRAASIFSLIITITCGLVFSVIQKYEYDHATFSINDGAYGSVFYMLTGFHGLHVIIGTVFLIICLIRHYNYHFFKKHFTGFICGTWY
jgi:heme/copper-type cytochrome/quinol oxidase subunit 3